jgi:hypothetical protein
MLIGAGAAVSFAAARGWMRPRARFARMSGSSVGAGWVTDFLNAAYYRRRPELRDVEDLRLAFAVVSTYWHRRGHRRLHAVDVAPFHRAFGRQRFVDGARTPRGTLDHLQLLEGAGRLLGPWFADAYADDARRGWGIAFEAEAGRAAHAPEERLRRARLGPLTPPQAPGREHVWHTYPPVEVPSADGVVAALSRPETSPDDASEIGRFAPVRAGGLEGQTFEIEVAAGIAAGRPVFTRGYVTITRLVSGADRGALDAYVADLNDGLQRFGRDEPPAVPEGAAPVLAFDLTTHEGHFMGAGRNGLVLDEEDGRALVRAAGTWDPMPWHVAALHERAGRDARHAFWGQDEIVEQSMLHQIARRVAAAAPR